MNTSTETLVDCPRCKRPLATLAGMGGVSPSDGCAAHQAGNFRGQCDAITIRRLALENAELHQMLKEAK